MIHPAAVVGDPPQHRDHKPGDPTLQPVIDPSATIRAFATVDAGIHRHTAIGARTLIMASVHIGHDVTIGADCEVAPMTSIAGHVTIGDRVRIGQNVCVKPFVTIGDNARIGMGSVVTKDVPAGELWYGNPAQPHGHARPTGTLGGTATPVPVVSEEAA